MPTFFLGAGASKALGYPTTKEFKDILATKLDDKFQADGNLPEGEKILLTTLRQKIYPDIEYVLDFWKRLLELKNKEEYKVLSDFLNSNHFAVSFDDIYRTRQVQQAVLKTYFDYNESLIDYVTNILYSTYSLNSDSAQKASTVYSPLLTLVNNSRVDIFTTNYDSVIEQYCKGSEWKLIDGFKYDEESELKKWNPLLFDENTDRKCITLYKLHGSLNWKQHKKHGIVKLDVEKIMKDNWEYDDDLLIKPTLTPKEEEGYEPFKTLFSHFDERIKRDNTCVVIGYSFRDRRVNEIFNEFLKGGNKLVIVSPTASEDFNKNFVTKFNKDSYSCVFIEEELNFDGAEKLTESIRSKLNG